MDQLLVLAVAQRLLLSTQVLSLVQVQQAHLLPVVVEAQVEQVIMLVLAQKVVMVAHPVVEVVEVEVVPQPAALAAMALAVW